MKDCELRGYYAVILGGHLCAMFFRPGRLTYQAYKNPVMRRKQNPAIPAKYLFENSR